MNKDNSLTKIDVVKLLLWLSVIFIAIFTLSALLIIPNTNKLKVANEVLSNSKSKYLSNVKQQEKLEDKLNKFLEENKVDLSRLHNDFDIDKFTKHCKTFFDEVLLEKKINLNDDYISYQLSVSTKIPSPTIFYNFIDSLDNYPNIIKIHFPINMQSSEKLIKAQFDIQVYKR